MTEDTDSTDDSPFGAMFEMQRDVIEQGQQFAEESASAPAAFAAAMRSAAVEGTDVHRRTLEVGQRAIEDILEAIEATTPTDEAALEDLRQAVEGGFDDLLAAHDDMVESADEAAEAGIEEYEAAVDGALSSLDAQLDLILDANDDFEARTLDALEVVVDQYESLQAEIEGQSGELSEDMHEQLDAFEDRLATQIEQYRSTLADLESRFEALQSE
ncbi:poly(3-hydroxyalkanoate) polymerase subunit PhaC [Halodesulfurarchaeum formicicum]|uniref:Poly(3-hydroxyalkanoate) polymerase subunit PhaC n=1 Tax=Halodesulfurarchaeum formicicum TaxID=1873524 RepID=A0A1D8S6L0_9EURY|nr:hypothetical protein [Halodesulfurarchaeum formicicum]AOW80993.1 poly(3-hydroxyalkanoate) polymerase subunit PhaC [Halodesulfurarchaeum formicicum]APE96329.1 poly(3-hydroxyalkanoate) polymerase subunit PhaC [Halodesulfurarchaeum formicicum]